MISDQGRDLLIWIVVFTALLLYTMVLRFYVLFVVAKRAFRLDDFFVLLSAVSLIAGEGVVFWAIANGLGAHTASLPWSDVVVNIKLSVSSFWTWTISTCSCKLAVLSLYTQLFSINKNLVRATYVLMFFTAVYAPAFIAVFMTECQPVSAFWDPVLSQTNCRPIREQELASVAINLVLDAAIVILPMPVLWKLKMTLGKKIGVTGIFSLGGLVIAVSIWRLVTTVSQSAEQDVVYDLYILSLQSFMELWFGILAANMPALAPIMSTPWAHKMSTALGKYMSYLNRTYRSSQKNSQQSDQPVSLITFGSHGKSHKTDRGDFSLLSAGNDASEGTIMTTREYAVYTSHGDDHKQPQTESQVAAMV